MTSEMTRKLSLLASQDPFFLSWYFARYSEMMSADIVDVASEIGCLPEVMNTMSLCRAPRTEPPNFQQDVEAIANRFQLPPERLANLVRQVQTVSGRAMLLAARDSDTNDGGSTAQGE